MQYVAAGEDNPNPYFQVLIDKPMQRLNYWVKLQEDSLPQQHQQTWSKFHSLVQLYYQDIPEQILHGIFLSKTRHNWYGEARDSITIQTVTRDYRTGRYIPPTEYTFHDNSLVALYDYIKQQLEQ